MSMSLLSVGAGDHLSVSIPTGHAFTVSPHAGAHISRIHSPGTNTLRIASRANKSGSSEGCEYTAAPNTIGFCHSTFFRRYGFPIMPTTSLVLPAAYL